MCVDYAKIKIDYGLIFYDDKKKRIIYLLSNGGIILC